MKNVIYFIIVIALGILLAVIHNHIATFDSALANGFMFNIFFIREGILFLGYLFAITIFLYIGLKLLFKEMERPFIVTLAITIIPTAGALFLMEGDVMERFLFISDLMKYILVGIIAVIVVGFAIFIAREKIK